MILQGCSCNRERSLQEGSFTSAGGGGGGGGGGGAALMAEWSKAFPRTASCLSPLRAFPDG